MTTRKIETLLLAVLFIVTVFLRVPNLGYSDYIGDEHKAFIELGPGEDIYSFFMNQRKGPMQFIVSYIPHIFTGTFRNELAERVPFTIFGIASVFVFYAFVRKLTDDKWIAFTSSLLLSVNGFIIGFSRIAQYQNLNLFFSFLALYFYADFLKPSKNLLRNTMLGTVSFCLSILSHWDAVFILVPIIYFVIVFIKNKDYDKKLKTKVILSNFLLGWSILVSFLIPYAYNQLTNEANREYFGRRVELGHLNYERYKFLIELYNPFIFLPLILVLGVLSFVFFKSSWIFLLWFFVNYGVFEAFVRKPGTHIYNFIIPIIIAASITLVKLIKKLKAVKWLLIGINAFVFSFLIYQSYMIFVDHTVEYPWKEESLMDFMCKNKEDALGRPTKCAKLADTFETKPYSLEDKAPLFGFPLKRNWNEINDFVNEQNRVRGEKYKFVTNEVKTIADWYMDAGYGVYGTEGLYVVGIKYPLSFVNDWNFPQYGGKEVVHEIEIDGETKVKIYRIDSKEDVVDLR